MRNLRLVGHVQLVAVPIVTFSSRQAFVRMVVITGAILKSLESSARRPP
jgi:hypothetical protein